MRTGALFATALAVVMTTASSGCLGCDLHARSMEWSQEDFPEENYNFAVRYSHGEYGGSVQVLNETKTFILVVRADHPVSHEALVEFAQAMFEERGWPTPALNGTEEVFCADGI